jgi:rhamnogalacturonyl hydrolase YesR
MKKPFLMAMVLVSGIANTVASPALPDPQEVEEALRRANDFFIANNAIGVADWKRGAYQTGNYAVWSVLAEPRYRDRALAWAAANSWGLGTPYDGGSKHRLHADSQVAGQVYLDLYREEPLAERRAASAQVAQELVDDLFWNDGRGDTLDNLSEDDWWWVDAYYMAAPMLARMASIDGNEAYRTQLRTMYDWMKDTRALYDPTESLWYRDAASKSEFSSGGEKVFWSRGNGWVMAGLARVLEELPPAHPDRVEFETMLQAMAAALLPLQWPDGFWRSSLLDPAHYPNPETSGTAFFTAAMAWGIRNGVLDTETYGPAVAAAWEGLTTTALRTDGRVGYIQNVGRAPAAAGATETHDFGVGAFLLAGAEMLQLVGGAAPVLPLAGPDQFQPAGPDIHEATFLLDGSATQLREGAILQATWWIGDMFLAEGLVTEAVLPRGSHVITLRITHDGGGTFEARTIATLGGTGQELGTTGVTASTWQDPNIPANSRDGDLTTRWSAEGTGQWIQFDLGAVSSIESADIAFYQGDSRTASFDIAFSDTGADWQVVLAAAQSSGTTTGLQPFSTGGQPARFIRITGFGNSVNAWNSFTEVVIRQVPGIVDADGNGLPDAWEITRLGVAGGDPEVDSDGDGSTDREEHRAGTDPQDGSDFPRIEIVSTNQHGGIRLGFLARAAFGAGYDPAQVRLYHIEHSPDLTPGSWQPAGGHDPFVGRNLPVEIEVPKGYYRLRIELGP